MKKRRKKIYYGYMDDDVSNSILDTMGSYHHQPHPTEDTPEIMTYCWKTLVWVNPKEGRRKIKITVEETP
jgi:hypothetical protein